MCNSAYIVVNSVADVQTHFREQLDQGDSAGAVGVVQTLWAVCSSDGEYCAVLHDLEEELQRLTALPANVADDLRRQLAEVPSYEECLLAPVA
jgi:hypothetical protein